MAINVTLEQFNTILNEWREDYHIFAPARFKDAGAFSDTDQIRYDEITAVEAIIWNQKTHFSFKEVILPITQRLFYFTESAVTQASLNEKQLIVFLRSCDLHAVKRLDEVYLGGEFDDIYYRAFREKTKFVVMGCAKSFDSCFCLSMETNRTDDFDGYVHLSDVGVHLEIRNEDLKAKSVTSEEVAFAPEFVTENETVVHVPEKLNLKAIYADMWEEYSVRCIGCGRCNFSCPTCTCFTTQDVCYKDNPKCGERRRVWASCQVDGFTTMAGNHNFREPKGQRMRFKTLHKIYDFKKRYDYHMCVGCGRCTDVCPEYISFAAAINKLNDFSKEEANHDT